MYKCECGKEFEKANSFNGHKSNCITHLISIGKIKDKHEWLQMKQSQAKSSIERRKKNFSTQQLQKATLWASEKHTCENCGKIMTEKFGSGRFCSRSCANTFSSNTIVHNFSDSAKIKSKNTRMKKYSVARINYESSPKTCAICKTILPYEKRFRTLCGDKKCHAEYMSIAQKKAYAEGRRTGWKYHNEPSYPEKYFMEVLKAHNISYKYQVPLFNGHSTYHLDFVINENINLEIDGQQHYREQYWISHDKKRDDFVKSQGFKIYRFKWSDPNNQLEMQQKIKDFFDWLMLP